MAYTWLNAGAWRVPPRDNKPLVISTDKSAQGRTRSGTWLEPLMAGATRGSSAEGARSLWGTMTAGMKAVTRGRRDGGRAADLGTRGPGAWGTSHVTGTRQSPRLHRTPSGARIPCSLLPSSLSLRHENHNKDIAAEVLYSTLWWNIRRYGFKKLKPDPFDIKLHAGLRECGRTTRSHTNLPPHMRIHTATVLVHFTSLLLMCFRLSPYIRPLRSPFLVTAAYCVYAARDEKTLLARRIVVIHAVLYFAFPL